MVIGEIGSIKRITFFWASDASGSGSFRTPKLHDYSHCECNIDYVFDAVDTNGVKGYMTGQKKGIQVGDYIVLLQNNLSVHYQVERIEYYASPADMWVALLSKK